MSRNKARFYMMVSEPVPGNTMPDGQQLYIETVFNSGNCLKDRSEVFKGSWNKAEGTYYTVFGVIEGQLPEYFS